MSNEITKSFDELEQFIKDQEDKIKRLEEENNLMRFAVEETIYWFEKNKIDGIFAGVVYLLRGSLTNYE